MSTVADVVVGLELLGKPSSKVIIWDNLCLRYVGEIESFEGEATVSLVLEETDREQVISKLMELPPQLKVVVWIAGCKRTFGLAQYCEIEDTITIPMKVI